MSYAGDLRKATNTWAAAYLRFTVAYGKDEYAGFLFAEDEDDVVFYQHVLSDTDNLCYVGCGGKSGVLTVFRKLQRDQQETGSLFIVDRDTDVEPFSHQDEVLRTAGYSWESHVCEPNFVQWLAQRRLNPSLSADAAATLRDNWIASVEAFREPLVALTALLRTALVLDQSLNLSQANVLEGAVLREGVLRPGDRALQWQAGAIEKAVELGVQNDEIVKRQDFYRHRNLYTDSKGKVLVSILRSFIQRTMKEMNCTFRGEYNSSKHLAAAMPFNHPSTDYIRLYANQRMGRA